ncbi:MAG: DUF1549 domain-containing protein, partial [Blastocatellia bacterium]
MPMTGGINTSNKAGLSGRFKRYVIVAFMAAGAIGALDQLGLTTNSLAALLGGQDRRPVRSVEGNLTGSDCSYLKAPENFRGVQARHRLAVSETTQAISNKLGDAELALVQASSVPRKNVIDNILFDRMARDAIASAPLSTDEEFIRRVSLDLTGRIPSAEDVTKFVGDQDPNKRDLLVDNLINSPEFVDKWTMFFGDLFRNNARSTSVQRYSGGRDAFYNYIKNSVAANKSYAQMATEMITATGDNFVDGQNNFIVGGIIPMGPQQDTMDGT